MDQCTCLAFHESSAPLLGKCRLSVVAMLAGSTLQDDIATTTRQLVAKGCDILGMVPGVNCERFHEKTCPQSATTPQSSSSIQLDRSPVGAGKLFHPV